MAEGTDRGTPRDRTASPELAEQDIVSRAVKRIQRGDRSGIETLYKIYFDLVWTYARVALDDEHLAEDVTQLTFERALRGIRGYTPVAGTPFRAWLFQIARNAIIDTRRRSRTVPWDPAALAGHQDRAEDPGVGSSARRGLHDSSQAVQSALRWITDGELAMLVDRLPAAQRKALTLRYFLDLETPEIAELLGCSPRAVHDLEFRARKFLVERLERLHGGASSRGRPTRSRMRLRRNPVLAQRRFALTGLQRGWQA